MPDPMARRSINWATACKNPCANFSATSFFKLWNKGRDEKVCLRSTVDECRPSTWKPQSGRRRPLENLTLVCVDQTDFFYWSTSTAQKQQFSLPLANYFNFKSTSRRRPDWGFLAVDLGRRPSTLSTLSASIYTDVFITPEIKRLTFLPLAACWILLFVCSSSPGPNKLFKYSFWQRCAELLTTQILTKWIAKMF